MVRILSIRWRSVFAVVCIVAAAAAVSSPRDVLAVPGAVIVSNQNNCGTGPTNDNSLAPNQTAYVWLVFNAATSVRGYTYEITGTNNPFDSGILKTRFNGCKKTNVNDFWAKFTTPDVPGEYTLTVFDATGTKVSSDNFSVS